MFHRKDCFWDLRSSNTFWGAAQTLQASNSIFSTPCTSREKAKFRGSKFRRFEASLIPVKMFQPRGTFQFDGKLFRVYWYAERDNPPLLRRHTGRFVPS